MTDLADAPSLEELLRPWFTAELVLTPGMQIRAGWRSNAPAKAKPGIKERVPQLVLIDGRSRLMIGFEPYTAVGDEHAALAKRLTLAAEALAMEVGVFAGGGTLGRRHRASRAAPEWESSINYVYLRPGQTHVRMDPQHGDVPRLDFISDEAICSLSFGVYAVDELGPEHALVASEFATAARKFAADTRAMVDAPWEAASET